MAFDISSLSAEDLAALKAALGLPDVDANGRSPMRPRQLHDLRLLPTKDDPRPTFFWSAEQPRNAGDLTKTSPYPRLMWHGVTGQEITVPNAKAQQTSTAEGFILMPPANAEAPDPAVVLQQQLAQLSDADRKAIFDDVEKARLAGLKAAMSEMSDADRALLIASFSEPATKRRTA